LGGGKKTGSKNKEGGVRIGKRPRRAGEGKKSDRHQIQAQKRGGGIKKNAVKVVVEGETCTNQEKKKCRPEKTNKKRAQRG